ncbi:MAG: hypothetical protein AMXMBFR64_53420 [Myxococcales bacterium]
MTDKECPKCGRSGPVAEMFGMRNMTRTRKDGSTVVEARPQSYCRDCRSAGPVQEEESSLSSSARTTVDGGYQVPFRDDEPLDNEWATWGLERWNWRLLNHFFRVVNERSASVVVLLVTADELARAVRAPSAQAEVVRSAFLNAVRTGIRRSGSLLEHASDYQGYPEAPPRSDALPRFVAHLLFTCIAASESSEELGNEGQFLTRLRDLSDNQLPDHSLPMLPRLWQHLATWLQRNSGRYRPLVLPNPGGLTRIGHTVKLAFPDRRDQKKLSEILDGAGLAGHEPPVGRVLAVISSARRSFGSSFMIAFDEFRRLYESVNKQSVQRLVEHRFWAAVRDAALRGRGQASVTELGIRVSLLAEEEEDSIALFVAADERTEEAASFAFAELPIAYGPWQYALVPTDDSTLDAERLERTVRSVLEGRLRLPRISSLVEQGFLPFVAGSHGLLELATGHEQLGDVSVALVREALVPDLLRLIGEHSTRTSNHEGWVQIAQPRLRSLSAEEVERSTIARTWILQQSLNPMICRLVGGVRAEDGWLGVAEVLPTVVAPGASSVVLDGPSGRIDLTKVGEEAWTLPSKDLVGDYTVSVVADGASERRALRFHSTPVTETFKRATDPAGWITEGLRGTGTLEDQGFVDVPSARDFAAYCERAVLLGADVGAFVSTLEDASWRLTHFAGKLLATRACRTGEDAVPRHQIDNAHARRRWRTMLFNSIPDTSDPLFDESRRQARGAANNRNLPRREVEQVVPDVAPLRLSAPTPAVERLVRVIAGRAAARAGLDWSEWAELAQRIIGIEKRAVEHVTRAWMEAGLIDVASYARWWHKRIFARGPQLVAFKVGQGFGAALMGLVLPTTLTELQAAASRLGLLVEERSSVSSLVPRSLALRAPTRESLEGFATSKRLPTRWLDLAVLETTQPRHDGLSPPPTHYERTTRWHHWSLAAGESPRLLVEHHMRRDRPDFWTTSLEGRGIWSYDLNIARGWAAAQLGEPLVAAQGASFLDAHHGFLPLPLARVVSALGGGLSGPIDGKHRYVTGTPQFREFVLDLVSRVFDPSRLAARVAEQAIG